MKHHVIALLVVFILLAASLAGCTQSATSAPTDDPNVPGATEVPKATDAQKTTDAPITTETPSAPKDIASSPAFRYYLAVNLGMTKDEADKAIGLPAEKAKGDYEPKGSYNYIGSDGIGVYVIYNDASVAFAKVAIYPKEAEAVAPLTAKPVTKDQKEQILKGAAHADIITLLGGDGVEYSRTSTEKDPAGPFGAIYHWANSDGSFIQIAFDAAGTAQNIMFHEAH